jgi:dTDP-4-dehydrorhamnose reductase
MALLGSLRPVSIVHCAAATNVDWCEEHPKEAGKINVDASRFLAEFTHQNDIPFVYISTDAVFDGTRGNYTETDEPFPVNVYARSKLQGEQEVFGQNPKALVARVTLYGWSMRPQPSLAEWIVGQLRAGSYVPGFTDAYFAPLLANDLAELILTMLDRGLSGLYHVVGSERISKYEFARSLARAFGQPMDRVVPTKVGEARLKARRPLDTSLNTHKIAKDLGYSMPDVQSGLCRFRELHENGYRQRLNACWTGEVG